MDVKERWSWGKHHTDEHARLAQAAKRQQTNYTRQGRGDHSAGRLARGRSQRTEAEPEGRGGTGAGEPPPIDFATTARLITIDVNGRDDRAAWWGCGGIPRIAKRLYGDGLRHRQPRSVGVAGVSPA